MKKIALEKILSHQGFGSRRHCRGLIQQGEIKIQGQIKTDPLEPISTDDLILEIQGNHFIYREKVYIALHKPVGYECSHQPTHHPSIYTLLPDYLIHRGIQCVGRLDQDTSGLILLSDDGDFIHALTSPKKNIGKTYQIKTADPISESHIERLLAGVILHHETQPARAIGCLKNSDSSLTMTITEGRYHQVKRMIGALGNRVVGLHRSQIGIYALPENLPASHWVFLSESEAQQILFETP